MKKLTALIRSGGVTMGLFTGCGKTDTKDTTASVGTTTGTTAQAFGKGKDITVVSREDGSGTRGAFVELVEILEKDANGNKVDKTTKEAIIANKTDVMITNISGDEYAIGYVSLGSLSDNVKALNIDGVEAKTENVKSGEYKAYRPFNIAVKENPS